MSHKILWDMVDIPGRLPEHLGEATWEDEGTYNMLIIFSIPSRLSLFSDDQIVTYDWMVVIFINK